VDGVTVQIHSFWKMPDADIMDDIVFTLPMMKELGDQVQVTAKAITCLWRCSWSVWAFAED